MTKRYFSLVIMVATALSTPSKVAASTLYATAQGVKLATVNQSTAVATLVGSEPNRHLHGLTSDWRASSFRLWAFDGTTDNLLQINPNTSQGTLIGHFSSDIRSIAFDAATEQLYGLGWNSSLYRIDANTAALTPVASVNSNIGMIAFGPSGILYGGGLSLYTISTSTGAASEIGSFTTPPGTITNLAVRPEDGAIFGVENDAPSVLYSINSSTGEATVINPIFSDSFPPISSVYALAFSTVPEPSVLVLVAVALATALLRRQ